MKKTAFFSVTLLSLWTGLNSNSLLAGPALLQSKRAEPAKSAPGFDLNDLCQHWVHSSEEEKAGENDQIFRPAAFQFPPSRFRMAYKFARNGDCEWLFLSPDDAHHFKAGKWMIDASDNTIIKITANGTTKSYRIAELSGKVLRLTPQDPKPGK